MKASGITKLALLVALLALCAGALISAQASGTPSEISAWNALAQVFQNGGDCTLMTDVTYSSGSNPLEVAAGKIVKLNLNGHVIDCGLTSATNYGYVIKVSNGATLTITTTRATNPQPRRRMTTYILKTPPNQSSPSPAR